MPAMVCSVAVDSKVRNKCQVLQQILTRVCSVSVDPVCRK